MLGTVVNNKQLIELQNAKRIYIHPFDQNLLKTIHYPLTASKFFECVGRDEGEPRFNVRCDFGTGASKVEFGPREYLVAQITQSICLQEGIVGHFVPSSKLVDYGFTLTCGRIEAPYGQQGEVIRFGVGNQLNNKNMLLKYEVFGLCIFYRPSRISKS
jgi:hypothetical protein